MRPDNFPGAGRHFFGPLRVGPPVAIAIVTFFVFAPSLWNQFLNWDDSINFVNNPSYRGLGWTNLRWMATTFLMGQWIPLTWLTLGIDYSLWQMNPFGYHLTNILLHAATAAAWYLAAKRLLTAAAPRSGPALVAAGAGAAALFFALHPLRAESVAWVTERRDVLSGFFFMLALLTYVHSRADLGRPGLWLKVSIGCYALAALSKSVVVTFPLVLLLLDVYPLRRLDIGRWATRVTLRLAAEKIPYFAIALGTGLMAIWAQRWNSFLTPLDRLPLVDRSVVVLYSVWFYFTKTLAPIGLSPLYELPLRVPLIEPRFLVPALGALALAVAALVLGRIYPAVAVAWLAYLVMLAPVSGILHNGHQLAHDRYSYLACLPWAILLGGGVMLLLAACQADGLRRVLARTACGLLTAWLLTLGFLTSGQVKVWRDDDTLWRYALEGDPDCSICHANLGVSLLNRGLPQLAVPHFEEAIRLRPDRVRNHGNLGIAFMRLGRPREALAEFRKVLVKHPDDLNIRNNAAVCLLELGRHSEAQAEFRAILEQDPGNLLARTNLGVALVGDGRAREGVSILEGVVRDSPSAVIARAGLARGYLALARPAEAREAFEALRAIDARAADSLAGLLVTTW